MPRKRFLTLEEALDELFRKDSDDEKDEETDIVVVPPDAAEASDEEEGDECILNNDSDVLPNDTAGEVELHTKKKFDQPEISNKAKKRKLEELRWSKKEPTDRPQPVNDEEISIQKIRDLIENNSSAEIFNIFFDSDVLSLLIEQTNLYAQQKNRPEFKATQAYMRRFIGILLLTGYHSLPQEEMYWSLDKDISVPIVREAMSRSQYRNIKQNLHLADNTVPDKNDKLYKVRPYLNLLNAKFQQFGVFSHNLSIDEQMIPYRGKHSAKMFLKGKPVRFGYKAWTLASSDGYVFNFDIYTGKSITSVSSEYEEFGLGGSVVINLLRAIENPVNHAIYFDNFFTSFYLLSHLKAIGFHATGTVRENRLRNCPLEPSKSMKKKERGSYDFQYEEKSKIIFVRWNDNSVVTIGSTFGQIEPLKNVTRYSKNQKKKISVPQPRIIEKYNMKMGGVDLCDNWVSNYRIRVRGKKWWWPIFTNYIDVALTNAWKLSRLSVEGNKKPLLDFRREVALHLLQTPLEIESNRSSNTGRPSKFSIPRQVYVGHFIIKSEDKRRLRCKNCHSQTIYRCNVCNVALHHGCSEIYHN